MTEALSNKAEHISLKRETFLYAVKRNIWHWYTVNGQERYYREQKDLRDFALKDERAEYHGFIYDKSDPNKAKKLELIGYSSDSVYEELARKANKIAKNNRLKLLTGDLQHGKSTVITKPAKIKIISEGAACCYCEKPLTTFTYTEDHLTPRSKGGPDHAINTRPCCVRCNREKIDLTLTEYISFLQSVPQNDRVKTALKNAIRLEAEIK